MTKEYKILNIHCADCARVLAEALSKLDGVEKASIIFVLQKLQIDFSDGVDVDEVMQQVMRTIHDFSPKITIEDVDNSFNEIVQSKKWKIEGLDCVNCATELQDKLNDVRGIKSAIINFKMSTLYVEYNENINREEEIIQKCKK